MIKKTLNWTLDFYRRVAAISESDSPMEQLITFLAIVGVGGGIVALLVWMGINVLAF